MQILLAAQSFPLIWYQKKYTPSTFSDFLLAFLLFFSSLSGFMGAMDDSNPFLIQTNDNPSLSLITHPLSDENYNSWKKAIKMALLGKNKFGFVDGSILEPPLEHSSHALWQRNDSIVASWLLNSLTKEIQVSIIHCCTAQAIWNDLNERFEQKNGPLIFQLKHELANLQQGSMSVSSYYSKLRSI